MNLRCLLVLAVAGTCGVVPWGHATESLRLQEAVSRALASNPALVAESEQLRATRARAGQEGLPPPLVVVGDLENVAGTGTLSGVGGAETTLRISRAIELGGKRAARQALGTAEINQQQNLADAARLDIAHRTTTRFIEVLADQQRLEYADEQVAQAERTRGVVAQWVKAARNPESDLHAAEIALAQAELEYEHAEHELESARVTLAASWGALTPDFAQAVGDLDALPDLDPFQVLAARLPMTLEQQAMRLEAQTLAAKRTLAQAGAKPDINLSLGVRRLENPGDQGLVMSVSVPLGSQHRAAFPVSEADAQLAANAARREAQRFEGHQVLFEKYQELQHARTEIESLRTRMLPRAEQALVFTRRGFEAGRFSFLALAQAQQTLFALRARSVEATAQYHTLRAEVDRLTATAQDPTP